MQNHFLFSGMPVAAQKELLLLDGLRLVEGQSLYFRSGLLFGLALFLWRGVFALCCSRIFNLFYQSLFYWSAWILLLLEIQFFFLCFQWLCFVADFLVGFQLLALFEFVLRQEIQQSMKLYHSFPDQSVQILLQWFFSIGKAECFLAPLRFEVQFEVILKLLNPVYASVEESPLLIHIGQALAILNSSLVVVFSQIVLAFEFLYFGSMKVGHRVAFAVFDSFVEELQVMLSLSSEHIQARKCFLEIAPSFEQLSKCKLADEPVVVGDVAEWIEQDCPFYCLVGLCDIPELDEGCPKIHNAVVVLRVLVGELMELG